MVENGKSEWSRSVCDGYRQGGQYFQALLGKAFRITEDEETSDVMKEMSMEEKPKALPKTGSLDVILTQIIETNDYDQFAKISISNKQSVCWL